MTSSNERQMATLAVNLQGASDKVDALTPVRDAVFGEVSKIEAAIKAKKQEQQTALSDYRAGTIDLGTASIIEKSGALDIADLETLLVSAKQRQTEVDAQYASVCLEHTNALKAFQEAELSLSCLAMDEQVLAAESHLCKMLAKRYDMKARFNNSLQGIWFPTPALKDAMDLGRVPRVA